MSCVVAREKRGLRISMRVSGIPRHGGFGQTRKRWPKEQMHSELQERVPVGLDSVPTVVRDAPIPRAGSPHGLGRGERAPIGSSASMFASCALRIKPFPARVTEVG